MTSSNSIVFPGISELCDKIKAVAQKQDERDGKVRALERGDFLGKLLGVRRLKEVIDGRAGDARASVLEDQESKIETVRFSLLFSHLPSLIREFMPGC
jgi:hypothetical protein